MPATYKFDATGIWHSYPMAYYVSHTMALQTLGALAARQGRPSMGRIVSADGVALQPSDAEFSWLKYSRTDSLLDASISSSDLDTNVMPVLSAIIGCDAHELSIDVLTSPDSQRHRASGLVPHQWSAPLPPGSFIWLSEHLRVCSPEYCFLLMARVLPFIDLVILGYSMCGMYHPANIERGFVSRCALTSTDRLRRYLGNVAPGTPGIGKALAALDCIMNDSNSPLETIGALRLTLPAMLGGLQLPHPILNARIDLSPKAQELSHRQYCVVDAYWPKGTLVLEFLGSEYHQDISRDTKRLLGLEHDGLTVRELTAEQVKSTSHISEVGAQVKQKLGLHVSHRPTSEAALCKRDNLGKKLFPSATLGPGGALVYPKPSWALPANFAACAAEERRYSQLKRMANSQQNRYR